MTGHANVCTLVGQDYRFAHKYRKIGSINNTLTDSGAPIPARSGALPELKSLATRCTRVFLVDASSGAYERAPRPLAFFVAGPVSNSKFLSVGFSDNHPP
jgi:hypothetical protein